MTKFVRRTALAAAVLGLACLLGFAFAGSRTLVPAYEPAPQMQQAPRGGSGGRLVDLKSDVLDQREYNGVKIQILVGNVAAHHNGAVITCDSVVRYSDSHMECFGNVLINKGTTFIYGKRADYDGTVNMARVYDDIVKVVDKQTTLYTYNFEFNTHSNVGEYHGGGVVLSDDSMIESERGFYYTDEKNVVCVDAVQMRNDTYEMTGDSIVYNTDTGQALFFAHTNIWNPSEEEYLYADRGSFARDSQLYSLTLNAYVLTRDQELWSDSLDYYRDRGYAKLRSNIQLDDREQKMVAFGDWGEYWKEPGNVLLTRTPSIISYDTEQGDSLFVCSDSMFMYTRDPVRERKEREEREAAEAAEAERLAAAQAAKTEAPAVDDAPSGVDGGQVQQGQGDKTPHTPPDMDELRRKAAAANKASHDAARNRAGRDGGAGGEGAVPAEHPDSPAADSPAVDSLSRDSLATDSLACDSLAADSLQNPLDTLTKSQRKALLREQAKKEQAERRKAKAKALRIKLDSIAERRQAKRTAMLRKMERADSISRAKAKQRAEKHLRRKMDRLTRKGVKVAPADSSALVAADSVLLGAQAADSAVMRMLDSLIDVYYPREMPDTLAAADTVEVDSTYRLILAYRRVKMFRSDLQVVCDSLSAMSTDSIIHLYNSPILWNDNNQIVSEVMHVLTHGQKPVRADFEGKPLTAAELDTVHYNQVTGKEMSSLFRDGQIYRNDVNGNVQTIYYMQEDDSPDITMMAYIESADMTAYIENREIKGITYRGNPHYTFYPMDKIPEDQPLYLPGFEWKAYLRPSRDSVFTRTIRPSVREQKESLERPQFPISEQMERRKERLARMRRWYDRTDTLTVETIEWLENLTYDFPEPPLYRRKQ